MKLYKTTKGNVLHTGGNYYSVGRDWDELINTDNLHGYLTAQLSSLDKVDGDEAQEWIENGVLPPVGSQEVWAAGVTYLKSMEARMEEAKDSGAADLYDRVYNAERPELFFKSTPNKVMGHGQKVAVRKDSAWDVPEPELTLFINSSGKIAGYTVGNDMSSRSIEGENALYLPQAKVYDRSAALGPCIYIPEAPIGSETVIEMEIVRQGTVMFKDSVQINRIKRPLTELADYLYRENSFDTGAFLMTGTCLVPSTEFTLQPGDVIHITIGPIGTLTNTVAHN